jgi:hypothetical protein
LRFFFAQGAGGSLDQAVGILAPHARLLGAPGLVEVPRRGRGVVDLDGTRRKARRALLEGKEATRRTVAASVGEDVGETAAAAGDAEESEAAGRGRALRAPRVLAPLAEGSLGSRLWAAAAQHAPVGLGRSPWGGPSDGSALGGFAPIGRHSASAQLTSAAGSSSGSGSGGGGGASPWLGDLNRGRGAPPNLPGALQLVTTGRSGSGKRPRGYVFAAEPGGGSGGLSTRAAAAAVNRRRDAAHERRLFQEVYALPPPLCPHLANFSFGLGYASSLPAAEGRCTWQSAFVDLAAATAPSLAAPHEPRDVAGAGA